MTINYKKSDPHYKREKAKYEFPVPSREYLATYFKDIQKPVTFDHLVREFALHKPQLQEGLQRRLRAMEREGHIICNRRGSYALAAEMELVAGEVEAHRDGFGFLLPDDGSADVFLPAKQMREVFHKDRVLVRVIKSERNGRRIGAVAEILERRTTKVVGRFYKERGLSYVVPNSKLIPQDIIIPPAEKTKAKSGQFVEVKLLTQPQRHRQATAKVVEVLGDQLTPGMEVELAVRSHGLRHEWPKKVITQSKKYKGRLTRSDLKGRLDLRDLPLVTIDGEDARDFDDAVYAEPMNDGGWRVYVAIADVAHYVKPGSAIDIEGQARATSTYFPSRVIPMLPEVLSNGLCSLNPEVDRLALVCEMRLNKDAKVMRYRFHNAVIHSHARLTYTLVADILSGKSKRYKHLHDDLYELHRVFKKLFHNRQKRGALEFDTVETKILFDDKGKIKRIVPTHRNDAHRLIEELMLQANVCAAKYLLKNKIPALYRDHEGPDEHKLNDLRRFLQPFSLRLSGGDDPTPLDYSRLLKRVAKRDDHELIEKVMLRSLKQAVYAPENTGHFGLAYDAYLHFTSPIRRYPDLLTHRAIKHLIAKQKPRDFMYSFDDMQQLGTHCSQAERASDVAAREATDWLKCDYMKGKVGKSFEGYITDVTSFGVFVELKDVYVTGLVHVTSLKNDYYHYDQQHRQLRGKRSGKTYRLSDKLKVKVARVDLDERVIDFVLA